MTSLPILTFDERVLSPRFGYVFHRRWLDPYESVVGMLWKFVRMNRLAGHAVVTQICRQHVDPTRVSNRPPPMSILRPSRACLA